MNKINSKAGVGARAGEQKVAPVTPVVVMSWTQYWSAVWVGEVDLMNCYTTN